MLTLYIVSLVVGGALVVLSLFGGDSHHGGDHDFHAGADHDADHGDGSQDVWIPFFSLRFWTYFAMTFGAAGLILTFLVKTAEPTAGMFAGATGLITGLLVSFGMRMLSKSDIDSSIKSSEMMGKEAQVVVAIRPGQLGRVRISVKGEVLELLASSDDVDALEAGATAVIVEMDGDRVKVVGRKAIYGSDQSPEQSVKS